MSSLLYLNIPNPGIKALQYLNGDMVQVLDNTFQIDTPQQDSKSPFVSDTMLDDFIYLLQLFNFERSFFSHHIYNKIFKNSKIVSLTISNLEQREKIFHKQLEFLISTTIICHSESRYSLSSIFDIGLETPYWFFHFRPIFSTLKT
jgi:hypothetical protein